MVVDVKNDCPDVLDNIKSSYELELDKIRESAPGGATHYCMQKGVVLHYMMKYREDWYRYSESNKKYGKLMITNVTDAIPLYEEVTTTESILSERQAQYGSYSDVARITQEIKKSLLSGASYSNLSDEQKLSLDMIANKMARAVNGDVTYVDNWQDICGYGQLVVDSLNS
jgi:hypothetical protein